VIDLDIKGFFDNIDHSIMMRIVEKSDPEKWVRIYTERWLKVPGQESDGRIVERSKGTPQGGVISPLLANMFLDEAFDQWMLERFPELAFERYADDVIVHCYTKKQAEYALKCIRSRLAQYRLELHPEKTKIVYCKDVRRKDDHDHTLFTFLGYEFRPRLCRVGATGNMFVGFTPAVSSKAKKSMSQAIREWRLTSHTPLTLAEIAERINPVVRGWMNYFGAYCRSGLGPILRRVELALARWVKRKYKKLYRRRSQHTLAIPNTAQRAETLCALGMGNSVTEQ
jgi:group II intron reverse transcriptase/maturase